LFGNFFVIFCLFSSTSFQEAASVCTLNLLYVAIKFPFVCFVYLKRKYKMAIKLLDLFHLPPFATTCNEHKLWLQQQTRVIGCIDCLHNQKLIPPPQLHYLWIEQPRSCERIRHRRHHWRPAFGCWCEWRNVYMMFEALAQV
jgi:hypothetical protein